MSFKNDKLRQESWNCLWNCFLNLKSRRRRIKLYINQNVFNHKPNIKNIHYPLSIIQYPLSRILHKVNEILVNYSSLDSARDAFVLDVSVLITSYQIIKYHANGDHISNMIIIRHYNLMNEEFSIYYK